jgi:acetyl esterase
LLQPVIAAGRTALDLSDPQVLALMRRPGPPSPPAEGVTVTETTVTADDGHHVPVRVYQPEHPDARRPGYVLFHGGGWSFGGLETEHQRCVELTRRCGAVGVSVDYRLAPEHPAETVLADCQAALRWTVERRDVDPRRIAVTGSSAGGGLALSMAQIARDRGDVPPMLALAFYPNTDDRALPEYVSRRTDLPVITGAQVDQVVRNVRGGGSEPPPYVFPNRTEDLAGLCPTFMVIAGNDPLRDEGLAYATRLVHADVPTELHLLPGVAHAFDLHGPHTASTRTAYDLMSAAFDRASARVPE